MLRNLLLSALAATMLYSCKPQPVAIDVPQQSGAIIVSSSCPDENTVLVSASYSVNSLMSLTDSSNTGNGTRIPKGLLIDSAIVTLHSTDGGSDTLQKIADGIWGRNDLHLRRGALYQLNVFDCRKGKGVSASTAYLPQPAVDSLYPQQIITGTDTSVKLKLLLNQVTPGDYFVVCYNTLRDVRESTGNLASIQKALAYAPKKIELLSGADAQNGSLRKKILLQAKANDTLMVSVAQVDRASFDYFNAYKRTGSLINQLTGEPINLPGNITGGIGLFALYQPAVQVFDLNKM